MVYNTMHMIRVIQLTGEKKQGKKRGGGEKKEEYIDHNTIWREMLPKQFGHLNIKPLQQKSHVYHLTIAIVWQCFKSLDYCNSVTMLLQYCDNALYHLTIAIVWQCFISLAYCNSVTMHYTTWLLQYCEYAL